MKRRGFTLLEVVVGLVLLATVLVASLLALGRQRRVLRQANDRQQAISLADALLATWYQSTTGVPMWAAAPLVQRDGWWWKTEVAAQRVVFGRLHPIVRLQIVDRTSLARGEVSLLTVELLQPAVVPSAEKAALPAASATEGSSLMDTD